MNSPRYNYRKGRSCEEYEFFSEGPKGHIHKVVRFEPYDIGSISLYNLCFGDWNEITASIDDSAITNNGDAEKVLATVAAIVVNFTQTFEDAIIYAEGANKARTRRYQIGISKIKSEIEEMFNVYGWTGARWERFQKNINYQAFLIRRITENELILEEPKEHYMSTPSNNNNNEKKQYPGYPILIDGQVVDMRDYSKEPAFVKKTAAAKKAMESRPIPKEFLKK